MADSVEVATGYLTLVASAKGIKESIAQEMGSPLLQAGRQGGENLTEGMQQGSGGKGKAVGAFIGTALLAGLTAAIAGVGKLIGDTIGNEAQAANLTARLGLGPKDTARMGKLAGEVYAQNYGESLGQVNDAIVAITQQIGDGSKEWTQQTTKDILTVANTFEQDLGGTASAVGTLIKTGLVKDATEGLDLIVKGIQTGADKSGDLLDTFTEYSVQFQNMGLSGQEALGLINQGLDAGARNADLVADFIKEFAIEAVRGGDKVKGAYKSMGLDADDMFKRLTAGGDTSIQALDETLDVLREIEDPVKRNALAVELFGTKAEDMGQALFALDPSSAVDKLGEVEGATKKVGDVISDTADNRIETLKRSLQTNLIDFIGNKVIPFFQGLADKIDLSGIMEAVREFGGKLREIWDKIVQDVQGFVDKHQGRIKELVDRAGPAFEDLKQIVSDVLTAIRFLWDTFGEDIFLHALRAFEMVTGVISGALEHIKGVFQVFKALFTGDWQLMNEGLGNIVQAGFDILGAIIDNAMGMMLGAIGVDWEHIKQMFSDGIQWAKDKLNWLSNVAGLVGGWMADAKNAIGRKWDEIIDFFKGIPQRVKDAMSMAGTWLYDAGWAILQGLLNGLKAKWNEVMDFVKGIGPWIGLNKGPLSYDRQLLKPAGHAIMDGLLGGLQDRDAQLQSYIGSITNRLGQIGSGDGLGPLADISQNPHFTVNVYGSEGQSADSLSEQVINKIVLKRRVT